MVRFRFAEKSPTDPTIHMSRVESMISMFISRKVSVAVGIAIIFIVTIDLLTTRQILPL